MIETKILNTLQEYFGPQEQFDLVDYLHCFGKDPGSDPIVPRKPEAWELSNGY